MRIESLSKTETSIINENILVRGFHGGTLNIFMQNNDLNGNIKFMDCSARVFLTGGNTLESIDDGINSIRPSIKPSKLISNGGYNYSILASGCTFVYIRGVDI